VKHENPKNNRILFEKKMGGESLPMGAGAIVDRAERGERDSAPSDERDLWRQRGARERERDQL
jgi:hypothetical protein